MTENMEHDFAELIKALSVRRAELQMSLAALSHRSGVSLRTVSRVLSGQDPNVSFVALLRISRALGVRVLARPMISAHQFQRQAAQRKAEDLTSMVQATSALEAQAVAPKVRQKIKRRIAQRLLAGSTRSLWAK